MVGLSPESWSTITASCLSAFIAGGMALWVWRLSDRQRTRADIENDVTRIIQFALQYPYLEDDSFCSNWGDNSDATYGAMRYENYCCLVFNMLEKLWRYAQGNAQKIESVIYAPELIIRHRRWWAFTDNRCGYDNGFVQYTEKVLEARGDH